MSSIQTRAEPGYKKTSAHRHQTPQRRWPDSGKAVPWVRVHKVLEGVNWTHKAHLDANLECSTCHGQVEEMEIMASTQRSTCHAWPTEADFQTWTNEHAIED